MNNSVHARALLAGSAMILAASAPAALTRRTFVSAGGNDGSVRGDS